RLAWCRRPGQAADQGEDRGHGRPWRCRRLSRTGALHVAGRNVDGVRAAERVRSGITRNQRNIGALRLLLRADFVSTTYREKSAGTSSLEESMCGELRWSY